MSMEEKLKQIMADQAKLGADARNNQLATHNMEKQFGQFASAQNSRSQGGLTSNTDPNPKQVNAIGTRNGCQLEELAPKKTVYEERGKEKAGSEAGPSSPEMNSKTRVKTPSPFPQKFKKQKEDECFSKFIDLLKQVHVDLGFIDVFQGFLSMQSM